MSDATASSLRTSVIQFGTSRFLQAHADLFFAEGTPQRTVTVVQSSGDLERARRLKHLADGYPIHIQGLQNGERIDETRWVDCVTRTLSTARDWDEIERVFCDEAEIVLSNTGDTGFAPRPADDGARPDQAMSYPAKLAHLLRARHAAGGDPLTIFPMELVSRNGQVLRDRVMRVADGWGRNEKLIDWLDRCIFATSLVDRIVSEPIEPAGAVAEPYALWAIEAQQGLAAPIRHPAVRMVDDLDRIERLKLHILNLGHTAMVDLWKRSGLAETLTVGAAMDGPLGHEIEAIVADEVIPGFAVRGMEEEARDYARTTFERFRNPFLAHQLADIAQNHDEKVRRRIGAFLQWVRSKAPDHEAPRLDAIVRMGGPG